MLLRWFDPGAFLELIAEHQLQIARGRADDAADPALAPLEDYDLSSLRYVTSGGAPLAAEVAEQFVRRVPSVSIRQGYGLTETAALISSNPIGRGARRVGRAARARDRGPDPRRRWDTRCPPGRWGRSAPAPRA